MEDEVKDLTRHVNIATERVTIWMLDNVSPSKREL